MVSLDASLVSSLFDQVNKGNKGKKVSFRKNVDFQDTEFIHGTIKWQLSAGD